MMKIAAALALVAAVDANQYDVMFPRYIAPQEVRRNFHRRSSQRVGM
jgi:hypothetical protein